MDHLKQLDDVFIYLNHDKEGPERISFLQLDLEEAGIEVSVRMLLQILEKLCKEGYVSFRATTREDKKLGFHEVKHYYITYDGIQLLNKHKTYSRYLKHERNRNRLKMVSGFMRNVGMAMVGAGLALGTQYITTRASWLQSRPPQVQEAQSQPSTETINSPQ